MSFSYQLPSFVRAVRVELSQGPELELEWRRRTQITQHAEWPDA